MGESIYQILNNGQTPTALALASPNFHYYAHLRDIVTSYLSPEKVAEVDKAFVVADYAHAPQKRASGEP